MGIPYRGNNRKTPTGRASASTSDNPIVAATSGSLASTGGRTGGVAASQGPALKLVPSMQSNSGYDQIGGIMGTGVLTTTPHKPNDTLPKPRAGEKTTGQSPLMGGLALAMPMGIQSNLIQNAGGSPFAGFGAFNTLWNQAFPGTPFSFAGTWWNWYNAAAVQPRKGGYVPYRFMALDPTLNLVYRLIVGPIMASTWLLKPKQGITAGSGNKITYDSNNRPTTIPQWWVDVLSDMFLPMRSGYVGECLRFIQSGWRPFERVYEIRNDIAGRPSFGTRGKGPDGKFTSSGSGFMWLQKLKPLLPDFSIILDGGSGNYGGLTCKGSALGPRESWVCCNDVEAGNLYGYSRYEFAFDDWLAGQYARVRSAMLQSKLTGVLPIVYYRPGKTVVPDANGSMTEKDNLSIATQIVNQLFSGSGVACPTSEYTDAELQANPELAGLAPWKIEIVQAGTYAPAIAGMIAERQYYDTNKIRAMGWPERAVAEAQTGGSRADSEQHTDSASADRELLDNSIADQLNHGQPMYDVPGVVDEILSLNFGDDARELIEIQPAPLVDSKVEVYETLLKAALSNPQLATVFSSVVKWEEVFNHLDITCVDDVKTKLPQLIQASMDQQKQQSDAQIEGTKNALAAGGNPQNATTTGTKPSSNKVAMGGNAPPNKPATPIAEKVTNA